MTETKQTTGLPVSRKKYAEFAGKIFDLDEKVFQASGSGLSRVFTADRQKVCDYILELMTHEEDEHTLRAEIALIGNMARTIPEKSVRSAIMAEYNEIITEMHDLSISYGKDLVDTERQELNELNTLSGRFQEHHHRIICISRTFGSGGNPIGLGVADALHINYYDSEIFQAVLNRLEIQQHELEFGDEGSYEKIAVRQKMEADGPKEEETKASKHETPVTVFSEEKLTLKRRIGKLNRYHGLPLRDAMFFNMSDLILDMAQKEDFVVMGRCAGEILSNNHIPHVSIFITAPLEQRIHRMMEVDGLKYKEAKKRLKEVDRVHSQYYHYFTGKKWGDSNNYDLCLNSASYGLQGTIDFILNMLQDSNAVSDWKRS